MAVLDSGAAARGAAVRTEAIGRYLAIWAATAIALGVLVLIAAVVVDPYFVFGSPRLAEFNRIKPSALEQGERAKAAQLPRICGRTLILGNSRLEVGMNPRSPAWPAAAKPVFNAAVAGAGPDVALKMLRLAVRRCKPALVIAEVDFPDFLQAVDTTTPLPSDAPLGWRTRVGEFVRVTLTLDALVDTARTVMGQHTPFGNDMTPEGWNPMRPYLRFASISGYHDLFAVKREQYRKALEHAAHPVLRPQSNLALRQTAALITLCREQGIELVLLFPPYHRTYLDLVEAARLDRVFAAWKAAIAQAARSSLDHGARIRLFDFATGEGPAREPVPPARDLHTAMRYYWESGHFKAALGDLLVEQIFGADGFGRELLHAPAAAR